MFLMINWIDSLSKRNFLFLFSVILGIFSTIRLCSPSLMTATAWDSGIILDGSYRVYNGQIPHTDFYSPISPLIFIIGAIGFWIGGVSVGSIQFGEIVAFIIIAYSAILLFSRRMSNSKSLFLVLAITSFIIAPRIFNYPFYVFGIVGRYNSLGYSLILLMFPIILRRDKTDIKEYEYVSLGLLFFLLLFTKVTFAIAAGVFISMEFVTYFNKKGFLLVTGTFMVAVLCTFFIGFNIFDMILDFKRVAEVRNIKLHNLSLYSQVIIALLPYSFLALFVSFKIYKKSQDKLIFFLFTGVIFIEFFLCFTVMQTPEIVILPFYLLVSLFIHKGLFTNFNLRHSVYVILIIIPVLVIFLKNYSSLLLNFAVGLNSSLEQKFASKKSEYKTLNYGYSEEVIDFIKTNKLENKKIHVFSVNLITYRLKSPTPKNTPLYWHEYVTYSPGSLLSDIYKPENVFKEVEVLVIPLKYDHLPESAFNFYKKYIEFNFSTIYESSNWIVMEKN